MRLLGGHRVATSAEMEELGERIAARLGAGDVVLLTGPLGAGKTTLTRGIGRGLGVRGPVTSPTFVVARTHPSRTGGVPLVHVDAYRLRDALELDDLDLDTAHAVTVVEWGAGFAQALADSWLEIVIERPAGAPAGTDAEGAPAVQVEDVDEPRRVTVTGHGPRWE